MEQVPVSDLCRAISRSAVRIKDLLQDSTNYKGLASKQNSYGEDVKKMDSLANDVFIQELSKSGNIAGVASEELEEPLLFNNKKAKYVAVIDPMDGSKNIDYQITVGSIFGFYRIQGDVACVEDFLQPGNKLVLAGYTLHGPATTMVMSDGNKVEEHFLKGNNFFMHRDNIKCPVKGKCLSINACNYDKWQAQNTLWMFESLQKYSHRYVGSLVADFHRTLIDGGIFAYPVDKESKAKLRLLYECNPMAFIMKVAGGKAVSGFDNQNILDIQPNNLHQCSGLFIGSKEDVESSLLERK